MFSNQEKKRKNRRIRSVGSRIFSVFLSILLAFTLPIGNVQLSLGEFTVDAAASGSPELLIDEQTENLRSEGSAENPTQQSNAQKLTIESVSEETDPALQSGLAAANGTVSEEVKSEETETETETEAVEAVTVTLHQVTASGVVDTAVRKIKLEAGKSLLELLEQNPKLMSDTEPFDFEQYFWYTPDQTGAKQEYDLKTAVTEDFDLYYSRIETDPESDTEVITEAESETESDTEVITEAFTEAESETESDTEAFTEAESETESDTGVLTEAESETESDTEVLTEAESETESDTEAFTEAESEPESDTEVLTEAESEMESDTEAFTEAESETESDTEVLTEAESETESDTEAFTEAESETESDTEAFTEAESEPESDTEVLTEAESETESDTEAFTEAESETESESETMDEMEDRIAPYDGFTIEYYVAVDGAWKLVTTGTEVSGTAYMGGQSRRYLTAEFLEDIYGAYGFQAADLKAGDRIFPHTDSNSADTIWADSPAAASGNEIRVPISTRNLVYVFYMPHNVSGYSSYFSSSKAKTDATMLRENSFYTVNVSDDAKQFSGTQLPAAQSILYGNTYSVTLPAKEGVEWEVTDLNANAVTASQVKDADGQHVTITVENVTSSIRIFTRKEGYPIIYKAGIAGQQVALGQYAPVDKQQIEKDGSINGAQTYKDAMGASDTAYALLSLDSDLVKVSVTGDTNNRKFFYSFEGWKIEGTNTVLPAGTVLTREELRSYGGTDGPLTLVAVWKGVDTNNRIATVNFFLNKECEIMDNLSNGFQSQPKANFTNGVYATRILNTDTVPGNVQQILAPPTSADTAYTVDTALRKSVTTALDYGINLETFPSDEVIMAQLRATNATITMDGNTVPVEDLTTDNFAVRWYVLKYEYSDGWHIDGILVAKRGRFVVTKSFAGNKEAIDAVKNGGYSISVTHAGTVDYTLSLNEKSAETNASLRGYDSYDPKTDTYTWVLDARQNRTYTVKENNYIADQEKWNNTNRYRIYNSKNGDGTDSGGASQDAAWQTYPTAGVQITASSYASDEPVGSCQTVAFQNLYLESGVLTLFKIDATTGNGLKNVAFTIQRADGEAVALYRKPGTSQYSTDMNAPEDGYTELVSSNTMYTDEAGYIYVRLAVHSEQANYEEYYLEEIVPSGYVGARKIYVKVTDKGKILEAREIDASEDDSGWLDGKLDGSLDEEKDSWVLTVKNRSRKLTSVTAEKDWGDDIAEADRVPVTVALYRNGSRMSGSGYTQVLNKNNNWRYVWNDLPLYIDGEVAQYSLREIRIGNTAYDPEADEDGYRDYMVSYDAPKYRKGENGAYGTSAVWRDVDGNLQYADQILLVVHNGEIRGTVSFTKTDAQGNPLEGAEFTLYKDRDCKEALETVRSAANGFVSFGSHPVGIYYMKETVAPNGYRLSDALYRIRIRGGTATITADSDETDTPVTRIVNDSEIALIIKKTDVNGKALTGAAFTIQKDGRPYGTYTVGADGTIRLDKLEDGRYLISESEAPPGYQIRPEQTAIEVRNGTITFPESDVNYEFWSLEPTKGEDDCYTLTVRNAVLYELPSTGGPGIYWNFLIGTVMMCLAAGAMILWQRREKEAQKK